VTQLRLAVLGVGLIGGSIGLAARRRLGAYVVGCDPDAQTLERAATIGAIDERASSVEQAAREADYVFVATPVGSATEVTSAVLGVCGPECVVSDVGSTKRHIAAAISDPRFVAGHPLAGAETSGVDGAREDLFDEAVWYLTPAAEGSAAALARLTGLLEQLGASPVVLDAQAHDRLMASVSHLPHVLANVLVAQALRAAPAVGGAHGVSPASGVGTNPSFRDATRVAGANTAIWTDIYLSNSDLLAEALDEAIRELSGVRDALDAEDAQALAQWNDRACEQRARLSGREAHGLGPGAAPAS
jgi:prephenate dehydrogenase